MKYLTALALALLVFTACQKDDDITEELPKSNVTEGDTTMNLMSAFEDRVHPTSGTARLVKIDEKYFVELADFKTDSGPALYVYLSKEEDPKNFINLGELKATSGTFNYEVPASENPEEYPHVLIWCKRFSVLFGVATLTP